MGAPKKTVLIKADKLARAKAVAKEKADRKDEEDELRADRKEAFLKAFECDPVIKYACAEANISRRTHYKWLDLDEDYARKFNELVEDTTDELEKEAKRRAVEGILRPQFFKGVLIKETKNFREFSDVLLIFLLKARRPHVYRERMELMGPGGTPLNPAGSGSPTKLLVEFIKGGNADKQDPDPRKV